MRTVDYSDVLRGSTALAGLQPSDLTPAEFALFRTAHDRRLQMAWEIHRWPEICNYEQRYFRAPYDATHAYAAGDECFDFPTMTYYQALKASTGQAPTINGAVNSYYWALCQTSYQADLADTTTVHAIGDQVLNPADNQYYQLFNDGGYNVVSQYWLSVSRPFTYSGQYNGKPTYSSPMFQLPPGYYTLAASIYWDGTKYVLNIGSIGAGNAILAITTDSFLTVSSVWVNQNHFLGITESGPTFAGAGSVFSTALIGICWGLLKPFNRYVSYTQTLANGTPLTPIGDFLMAWDKDPRITTKLCPLLFTLSADGAQFATLKTAVPAVWLLYRLRRPTLSGDAWNATAVYASGQQVYYTTTAGAGNFYTVTTTTTAGQNPDTTPASFSLIQLPYTFRQYLIQGGYADWLMGDGQTDKAGAMEGMVELMLEQEADKLQRQQGQVNRFSYRS